MAYVVVFALSVFFAGLLLLVLLCARAIRQVKTFGRTVAGASERIADATAALDAVAPHPADTGRSRRTLGNR